MDIEKKPHQILTESKDYIQKFDAWLEEKVAPFSGQFRHEYSQWRTELDRVKSLVDRKDPLRVALIGTTGAGKSTFLNAVLGQQILPVGVMEPCTAFVTLVSHSPGIDYHVRIRFSTQMEWHRDLQSLISMMQPGDIDDDSGGGEPRRIVDACRKRIQAVYGISIDDGFDFSSLTEHPLPDEVQAIFNAGSDQSRRFSDPKVMLEFLKKLVRGESALWPLIKEVRISGPYDCLAGGIELVDLPGLNDPNAARVEVTREYLQTSPFVWVVFNMVRGLTKDIQEILREEKLLRTLILSGTYGALSLVGTKADDIDANIADQLGLDEEAPQQEIVKRYREQTIQAARRQLEEMILDLPCRGESPDTISRMVDVARNITVHATSSSAYIKIRKIAPLRRDYGLEDVEDTGIPGVLAHLNSISTTSGTTHKAQMAVRDVKQLYEQIKYFAKARQQTPSPKLEQARSRLQQEHTEFTVKTSNIHTRAEASLQAYRDNFYRSLDNLLSQSVAGVRQKIDVWRKIHWASLRAIVSKNGVHVSSSGQSYDLNSDLTDPLMSKLPVSWERYFTDDLGRVTDEFMLRIGDAGTEFCNRVALVISLIFEMDCKSVESQLSWFRNKVSYLSEQGKARILVAVRERRSELAATMPKVALGMMVPAYEVAKHEKGPGMKQRMLSHLEPVAIAAAQPIFNTIRQDLLEGLNDLELIITGLFREMVAQADEQSRMVAHNADIDVEEASKEGELALPEFNLFTANSPPLETKL